MFLVFFSFCNLANKQIESSDHIRLEEHSETTYFGHDHTPLQYYSSGQW